MILVLFLECSGVGGVSAPFVFSAPFCSLLWPTGKQDEVCLALLALHKDGQAVWAGAAGPFEMMPPFQVWS